MHEKIYERLKENNRRTTIQTIRNFKLVDDDIDNDELNIIPNKNIDLKMLLSKFGLIENSPENLEIINDFYEYLFKFGIKTGISRGKKLVINVIKENPPEYEKLMKSNPKNFTNIKIEPVFLTEFKEAVLKKNKLEEGDVTIKHTIAVEFSKEEYELIFNLRDEQLNILYDDLNVDKEKLEKINKRIITIRPKSHEYPFNSTLYKNHNGKYKFQTLMYQYHESILKESIAVGMQYGKRFIVEDLQNKRFDKEYIENMGSDEIKRYCSEIKEDI